MKMKNKIFILIIFFFIILLIMINIKKENNQKYVIVEVHDVSPVFNEELKIIFSELDKLNITKKTILVTPYLDNKDINDYPEFIESIKKEKKEGAEIALHGYTHERNEFSKGYEDVKNNLEIAINSFHKAFDFYPKGFVPGYWKENKNTFKALNDLGFTYTTTFTKIIYFNDKKINSLATLMVGSNKFFTFITKMYSIIYVRLNKKILRFTIHPGEIRMKTFDDNMNLLKKALDKGYKPVTYEELKTINLNR